MTHNPLNFGSGVARGAAVGAGLDETAEGVVRLSETLQGVMDPWRQPEWTFLRGEKLWSVSPSIAAVAGEFQQIGIRNPTGSNHIAVVEVIAPFNPAAAGFGIWEVRGRAQGTTDGSAAPSLRDTRIPSNASFQIGPLLALTNSEAATPLGTLLASFINVNEQVFCPVQFVLSPGFELFVGRSIVNVGVQGTIAGRVRPAPPGELNVR